MHSKIAPYRHEFDAAVRLLFCLLLLGFAWEAYHYLGRGRHMVGACAKVERVEWKFVGGNKGGDRAYAHYRLPGMEAPVRSRLPWISGGSRGTPIRDPMADAWLAADCVMVWYLPGREDLAVLKRPLPPFFEPFGLGQWMLALMVLLLVARALAWKKEEA